MFLFEIWAICSFPLFWWALWVNCSGHSPKMSDVSKSLRSLTKNEWPWAIRSGQSPKKSDHEWIAQVAHQKWLNEQIARFFEQIAHSIIFLQKTSDSLRKWMNKFPALAVVHVRCTVHYRTFTKKMALLSKKSKLPLLKSVYSILPAPIVPTESPSS